MKVIICGAGQVGFNLAKYLSAGKSDVTLIDVRPDLIEKATNSLDVRGIVGFASHPDTLSDAGAEEADLLIAVTQIDEINMIACQIAHSVFGVTTKVARVREQAYLDERWLKLFDDAHMPIDRLISPEREVARSIERLLEAPGAFDVFPFAEGRLQLCGVRCTSDSKALNAPLSALTATFSEIGISCLAIGRNGKPITATSSTVLEVDDELYFIVPKERASQALALFGHEEVEGRRVLIVGGGTIGLELAKRLESEHSHVRVKLIEKDRGTAEQAAEILAKSTILHGDALDFELLEEAGISGVETIVTVSNDDEVNILGALLGKQHGAERTVALVNSSNYSLLTGRLGIDAVVNPRGITVSNVLSYVRSGSVVAIDSILDGYGEVLEFLVRDTSKALGQNIQSLKLPEGVVIAGIDRADDGYIRSADDTPIEKGDRIILFVPTEHISEVEKRFAVRVDFV
ncbi:MAG: Trk system potassium transporter TrkA [Alphaproteobacteria bacterium]